MWKNYKIPGLTINAIGAVFVICNPFLYELDHSDDSDDDSLEPVEQYLMFQRQMDFDRRPDRPGVFAGNLLPPLSLVFKCEQEKQRIYEVFSQYNPPTKQGTDTTFKAYGPLFKHIYPPNGTLQNGGYDKCLEACKNEINRVIDHMNNVSTNYQFITVEQESSALVVDKIFHVHAQELFSMDIIWKRVCKTAPWWA